MQVKEGSLMISEVFIDFCFIRHPGLQFKSVVEEELKNLFPETIHWYLDCNEEDEYEMIVAELRGMGRWSTEDEVIQHLHKQATDKFWEWLQGCRIHVYPVRKGCASCG